MTTKRPTGRPRKQSRKIIDERNRQLDLLGGPPRLQEPVDNKNTSETGEKKNTQASFNSGLVATSDDPTTEWSAVSFDGRRGNDNVTVGPLDRVAASLGTRIGGRDSAIVIDSDSSSSSVIVTSSRNVAATKNRTHGVDSSVIDAHNRPNLTDGTSSQSQSDDLIDSFVVYMTEVDTEMEKTAYNMMPLFREVEVAERESGRPLTKEELKAIGDMVDIPVQGLKWFQHWLGDIFS